MEDVMRMGAIDEAKAYLSSPDKVADAFNYWVYGGRDIIKAEALEPMDTTAIALPYGNNAKKPIQKIRDVLKLYTAMRDEQAYYLMLGIEIQAETHYALPVRKQHGLDGRERTFPACKAKYGEPYQDSDGI